MAGVFSRTSWYDAELINTHKLYFVPEEPDRKSKLERQSRGRYKYKTNIPLFEKKNEKYSLTMFPIHYLDSNKMKLKKPIPFELENTFSALRLHHFRYFDDRIFWIRRNIT